MRAIDFNKNVLIIEKDKLGSYGIYNGALASKTMREFSGKIKTISEQIDGLDCLDIKFNDVKKVIAEAVFERKSSLLCQLQIINRTKSLINYEKGKGRFKSDHEIEILKKGGSVEYEIENEDGTKEVIEVEKALLGKAVYKPSILADMVKSYRLVSGEKIPIKNIGKI